MDYDKVAEGKRYIDNKILAEIPTVTFNWQTHDSPLLWITLPNLRQCKKVFPELSLRFYDRCADEIQAGISEIVKCLREQMR